MLPPRRARSPADIRPLSSPDVGCSGVCADYQLRLRTAFSFRRRKRVKCSPKASIRHEWSPAAVAHGKLLSRIGNPGPRGLSGRPNRVIAAGLVEHERMSSSERSGCSAGEPHADKSGKDLRPTRGIVATMRPSVCGWSRLSLPAGPASSAGSRRVARVGDPRWSLSVLSFGRSVTLPRSSTILVPSASGYESVNV